MNTYLGALSGATVIVVVSVIFWSRWQQRDLTPYGNKKTLLLTQTGTGLLMAPVLGASPYSDVVATPWIAAALAAMAATAATAVLTDIGSQKIPKEPCHAATLVGVVAYLSTGGPDRWGLFSVGTAAAALILVPMIAAIITRGGLGFGDIRLLTVAVTTLSWWVGAEPLMWGVITACFIQGVARFATSLRHQPKLPFGPALVAGITIWSGTSLFIL